MHCRAQTGRSMIEMLAVVAIIGILSVITFWGYEMAMARYHANELIKQTNMFALHIEQQFDNELDDEEFDLAEWQGDGVLKVNIAGYSGDLTFDKYTTAFEVKLDDIQKAVCEKIMNSGWTQPYLIYVNTVANGPCDQDENTMSFAFNNTLSEDIPACNPGSVWNDNDERCTGCEAGTYQDGNNCTGCPAGATSGVGSTACICPDGKTWDEASKDCQLCPVGSYGKDNTCITCPPGSSAPSAGATECTCPTGSEWNDYHGKCQPDSCDEYKDCPAQAGKYIACVEHVCKAYTSVAYLQSDGTLGTYIDTGVTGNQDTELVITAVSLDNDQPFAQ